MIKSWLNQPITQSRWVMLLFVLTTMTMDLIDLAQLAE